MVLLAWCDLCVRVFIWQARIFAVRMLFFPVWRELCQIDDLVMEIDDVRGGWSNLIIPLFPNVSIYSNTPSHSYYYHHCYCLIFFFVVFITTKPSMLKIFEWIHENLTKQAFKQKGHSMHKKQRRLLSKCFKPNLCGQIGSQINFDVKRNGTSNWFPQTRHTEKIYLLINTISNWL